MTIYEQSIVELLIGNDRKRFDHQLSSMFQNKFINEGDLSKKFEEAIQSLLSNGVIAYENNMITLL